MGTLARIRNLEKVLTVEIVIKPEDDTIHPNPNNPCAPWIYPHDTIEAIPNPDVKAREAALIELRKIYDNSKWYKVFVRGRIRSILERYEQLEQKPQSEPTSEDDEPFEPDRKSCEHSGRGY